VDRTREPEVPTTGDEEVTQQEKLEEQVKTLNDYIKQLEKRIKTLEQDNRFVEEVNIRLMQQGTKNESR
jgi:predicted nuclease with TOPRIM domain